MIIFSFKERRVKYDWSPVKATRWSLKFEVEQSDFLSTNKNDSFFIFFGFVFQHSFKEDEIPDEWHDSHNLMYSVSWSNKNEVRFFKSSHIYYDGPHCCTSFGKFRLSWYNDNCKKCQPWLLK
jgi:hypothetical protein